MWIWINICVCTIHYVNVLHKYKYIFFYIYIFHIKSNRVHVQLLFLHMKRMMDAPIVFSSLFGVFLSKNVASAPPYSFLKLPKIQNNRLAILAFVSHGS